MFKQMRVFAFSFILFPLAKVKAKVTVRKSSVRVIWTRFLQDILLYLITKLA